MESRTRDLPRYKAVSTELLLIGVAHDDIDQTKPQGRKLTRFRGALATLDHLALEHSQISAQIGLQVKKSYETVALLEFRGNTHFLGGKIDLVALAEEYGISKDIFGVFKAISVLPICIDKIPLQSDRSSFIRHLKIQLALAFQKVQPILKGFERIDIPKVLDIVLNNFHRMTNDEETFFSCYQAFKEFTAYLAQLRDFESYYPQLKAMQQEFKGKIGAILGDNHIDRLYSLLTGEIVNPPPDWKQFVATLDQETQAGIKMVESMVEI